MTWLAIVLGGVGTLAIRVVFLAGAHRMVALPEPVRRALRMIPPAALAALAVPALLRPEGVIDLWNAHLLAGIAAGLVGWRTKSLLATLVVGMVLVVVLQL